MLSWADAERILVTGRYVWLATTDPDGGPHLVQQWGVWIDDALYLRASVRDIGGAVHLPRHLA